MIGDGDRNAAIVMELPTQLTHRHIGLQKCLRGDGPQAHDDLGLKNFYLFLPKWATVLALDLGWVPIARWPTFGGIENVDVAPLHLHGLDDFVEELSREANHRLAQPILINPWGFPHHDQSGPDIAGSKDRLRTIADQFRTGLALGDLF